LVAGAWWRGRIFRIFARRLMTEAFAAAGRLGLSAAHVSVAGELALVDRLIDLLLALEPFEVKHSAAAVGPGGWCGSGRR
jgi:hypothetical protein